MTIQIESRDRTNNAGPVVLRNNAFLVPSSCPVTEDPRFALQVSAERQYAGSEISVWNPTPFTVEAWASAESPNLSESSSVFSSSNSPDTAHSFQIDIHDSVYYFNHTDVFLEIGPVEDGQVWQHLAVTYDGMTLRTFMNGSLAKSRDISLTTAFTHVKIGANRNLSKCFRGKIDEVRLWDYARQEDKINTQKSESLVGDEAGFKAYYRFDENPENPIRDGTGNGYDLKVIGNPVITNANRNTCDYSGMAVKCGGNPTFGEAAVEEYTTNSFSVVVWASAARLPVPKDHSVFASSNNPKISNSFQISSDGTNYIFRHTQLSVAIGPIEANWQNLAVTYDGKKLSTYMNGNLANEETVDLTSKFTHYYIGSNRNNDKCFTGLIDEVQVWDHARTPENLKETLKYRASAHLGDMKAYWRFGERRLVAPEPIVF